MSALRLVSPPRRRRRAAKMRDAMGAARWRAQEILQRHGHLAIKVRMSRATIGEIYNHARSRESLLTYRFGEPLILPTEALLDRVKARARLKTELLWAELKLMASQYFYGKGPWRGKARKPVRHPVWKGR